jgi:hypothetical protein
MNRIHIHRVAAVAALLTAVALPAAANGPPNFDIDWWTVDGGGGASAGGGFAVTGTIGQPDAGVSSGGDWVVSGGFWAGGATAAPPCPEDIDGSGSVDFGDLLAVLSNFGACPGCPEDLDGNGSVDFSDLLAVLSNFGPCP